MKRSKLDMTELMKRFCKWVDPFCKRGAKVWGNSPSFDLVTLENAAKEVGMRFPIPYYAENDYRTLTDLVYGSDSKPRPTENIAHDALADARFQARVCTQHDGSLPIVGVNTFRANESSRDGIREAELMRSTEDEKQAQVVGRNAFCSLHEQSSETAMRRLTEVAARQGNLFAELMEAVKVCSLGQITHALYRVGGQYRRNM